MLLKEKVLISLKIVKFLSNIASDPNASKYNLTFVQKEADSKDIFEKIWSNLHPSVEKPRLGMLVNDTKTGAVAE